MKRICPTCHKRIWRLWQIVFPDEENWDDDSYLKYHWFCKPNQRKKEETSYEKYKREFQEHKGHGYVECEKRGCKWHDEYDSV